MLRVCSPLHESPPPHRGTIPLWVCQTLAHAVCTGVRACASATVACGQSDQLRHQTYTTHYGTLVACTITKKGAGHHHVSLNTTVTKLPCPWMPPTCLSARVLLRNMPQHGASQLAPKAGQQSGLAGCRSPLFRPDRPAQQAWQYFRIRVAGQYPVNRRCVQALSTVCSTTSTHNFCNGNRTTALRCYNHC